MCTFWDLKFYKCMHRIVNYLTKKPDSTTETLSLPPSLPLSLSPSSLPPPSLPSYFFSASLSAKDLETINCWSTALSKLIMSLSPATSEAGFRLTSSSSSSVEETSRDGEVLKFFRWLSIRGDPCGEEWQLRGILSTLYLWIDSVPSNRLALWISETFRKREGEDEMWHEYM